MSKVLLCFLGSSFVLNRVLLISIVTIINIFLLISNLIMIIGIWKSNSSLKLSHKLYIFQCMIGLLDGFIMLPLFILIELLKNEAICYMELIILFGIINQGLLQMITLAILSILRYYAISCQRNISGQRVILIYILIYTVSLSAYSIPIWRSDISFSILFTCVAIISVILQAAIVFANVRLLKYVKAVESENHVNNINIDFHKRAVKTILLLSISFISCTSPLSVTTSIYAYSLKNGEHDSSSVLNECMQLTFMLNTLYSGVNSVIYIFRSKNIVEYYNPIIKNCIPYFSCNHITKTGNREEMSTEL